MSREVHVRFCERLGGRFLGSTRPMCESFFATLECELIDRCVWRTQAEARPVWPSLSSSRVGTTHTAVIHGWVTTARWTTNVRQPNSKHPSNERERTICAVPEG